MSDELVSSDAFFLFEPAYTIVNSDGFALYGLERSIVRIGTPEHGDYLPLFSDNDLADRFINAIGGPAKSSIRLQTIAAVMKLMKNFEKIGVAYVGIDVELGPNPRGRFHLIKDVIARNPNK